MKVLKGEQLKFLKDYNDEEYYPLNLSESEVL